MKQNDFCVRKRLEGDKLLGRECGVSERITELIKIGNHLLTQIKDGK